VRGVRRPPARLPAPRRLRQKLSRERRFGDRRAGQPDPRLNRLDRRGLERRNVGHVLDDDLDLEVVIELSEDDLLPADADGADGEETRIVSSPYYIS
jgi:hypothetical protein